MIAKQDIPRLTELIHGFTAKRILVLGDIMIDQFIWGQVERISPEAPVPVVLVQDESSRLGGAADPIRISIEDDGTTVLYVMPDPDQ